MKVLYEEGTDALTIPAAGVTAQRGEAVEVPSDIGKQLIEQGPWVRADKPEKKETK